MPFVINAWILNPITNEVFYHQNKTWIYILRIESIKSVDEISKNSGKSFRTTL
jgi:hypothetical protein